MWGSVHQGPYFIMTNIKEKLEKKLSDTDTQETNIVPFNNPKQSIPTILPEFAVDFSEVKERFLQLQRFVDEVLIPGKDYGKIEGFQTAKPSLYKTGGEKLIEAYGLAKHVDITNRVEDWEKPFVHYEVKTTLFCMRSQNMIAQGLGSCNSKEKQYSHKDAFNVANTILKMAEKRSFISAVLSATRSSSFFTQDIEDMGSEKEKPATQKQLTLIFKLAEKNKLSKENAKEILKDLYKVDSSSQLTLQQANEFIKYQKS